MWLLKYLKLHLWLIFPLDSASLESYQDSKELITLIASGKKWVTGIKMLEGDVSPFCHFSLLLFVTFEYVAY